MQSIKTPILTLLFLLFATSLFAQGIQFVHSLDEAQKQAKKENKMIFVDFYTSWCAPCKMMAADVFPLKEVGDYFNPQFVSVKIQCDDKGEGVELGKRFKVSAYPTLMFLDADLNVVHSTAGGLFAKGLIELAQIASDPNSNQLKLVKEWEAGNRDHQFAKTYFQTLMRSYRGEKASSDFYKYFDGLSKTEKATTNTFELMQVLNITPFSEPFEYLEQNKNDYYKTVGKAKIDSTIANAYLWYFKRLQSIGFSNKDLSEFDHQLALFKKKKYPFFKEYAQYYQVLDSRDAEGKDDVQLYMKRGSAFLKKYGKKNDNYSITLTHILGNLTARKDQTTTGIQWMEELLKRNNNPKYLKTYFYITWRNFQWDKALRIAEQMKANALAEHKSTEEADKNIQMIKDLKIKYPN